MTATDDAWAHALSASWRLVGRWLAVLRITPDPTRAVNRLARRTPLRPRPAVEVKPIHDARDADRLLLAAYIAIRESS